MLILGASFAGLEVYYQLRRQRHGRQLSVCIVDRQTEHGYIPLVQERLVQRLAHADTVLVTQRVVDNDPRARYVRAEVVARLDANTVQLANGETLSAQAVVVALGSELIPPPKLPGAEHLLHYKFGAELAKARARLLSTAGSEAHVVVIGGGVSGVELAGELAHYAHRRAGPLRVTLIESGPRLLKGMSAGPARAALHRLRAQGVQVQLRSRVVSVSQGVLQLRAADAATPTDLSFDLAFWAAGIRPSPALAKLALPLSDDGYLQVDPSLRCAVDGDIFACGDAVRVMDVSTRKPWPTMQRAIECLWQAKVVAKNLLAVRAGASLRTHRLIRYFPYGVSIGARSLVVYRSLWIDFGALGVWFRRFLMRQYFKRYSPAGLSHKVTHPERLDTGDEANAAVPDASAQRAAVTRASASEER